MFVGWVPLAVLALSYVTVESAAVGNNHQSLYDETFMRKLCAFLGATYVRSAKDPQCWYTWCHAGEPYHMQCPPGRAVSQHFYWSTDDPCTESDGEEKCVVGFLKKMHLSRKEQVYEELEEVDPVQVEDDEIPIADDVPQLEDSSENLVVSEYELDPLEELIEEQPEPQPEPEPVPELSTRSKVIVHQAEERKAANFEHHPWQQRVHVVDRFVPREDRFQYGSFPQYNDGNPYYRSYYPDREEPAMLEPHAEFQRQADEPRMRYSAPEGRQAPSGNTNNGDLTGEELPEEPLYDAEYIDTDYANEAHPDSQEEEDYANDYEDRFVDEAPQQMAPPYKEIETATNEPSSPAEVSPLENDFDDYEGEVQEEQTATSDTKEPMVYDYFKTHFVEEM